MSKARSTTLKAVADSAATQIRPLVRQLLVAEHDAAGIDFQYSRTGINRVGVESVLEPLQDAINRRVKRITGVKLQGEYVDPGQIRRLLDAIGGFFAAAGVSIDTGKLPTSFEAWTDHPQVWQEMPGSDGISRRLVPRYRLAIRPQLWSDASLARPLP